MVLTQNELERLTAEKSKDWDVFVIIWRKDGYMLFRNDAEKFQKLRGKTMPEGVEHLVFQDEHLDAVISIISRAGEKYVII